MATRDIPRTEANVQSDLHAFLLAAPLELEEHDIKDLDIVLEQQAGARKRIDVEAGFCVFEVKRDLRKGNIRAEAKAQLAGYVVSRTQAMNQRYVGVLTDGADWYLYHWTGGALQEVSHFASDPVKPDVDGLTVWIEGVLATSGKITPTPREIVRRLGATSPGHALDYAELATLYAAHRNVPTVKLKRELWARLLTTAFGTGFTDSDELFVEHTLLVATAEIVAHAVVGIDPASPHLPASSILSGQAFTVAQVHGVVESDFFDWVGEVPGGDRFVKGLARRLARFVWQDVEHDVLKVLYESVISTAQRKKLGEYYTTDWLADRIVAATVSNPLEQRVLDPACGSGTFVFHAIRHYLDAADRKGLGLTDALNGLTQRVIGMDLHPVAVTFARVTYLLAIGPKRLRAEDRPPISVPVYLGDSIQWGQARTLFNAKELVVPTVGALGELWSSDLRFPERTLDDAGRFDEFVAELARMAGVDRARGSAVPSLAPVFRRFAVHPGDQLVVTGTFETLCRLHDAGANHIWGYYVRNLARPVWLTRPENRVDVLVGNPPWLSYRFMTREMQKEFRALSVERGLWAGAAVATNQDLSALFILRTMQRYLKEGGRFGFVLPWSALRGRQFAGFRTGHYGALTVAFDQAWDLKGVKPAFFPVPACVVFGARTETSKALAREVEQWSGHLPHANVGWQKAQPLITRSAGVVKEAADLDKGVGSPYGPRFAQGATVVPRVLFAVEPKAAGPLGAGAGRVAVASRRSANEKMPWKALPSMEGNIERPFVRPMHLGETILPYRVLKPLSVVVPWDGKRLLDTADERLASYQGMADWWKRAEAFWTANRTGALSLREQLDYRRKLTDQFPMPQYRLVYAASGMYLAAAVVCDAAVIEHSLYWGAAGSLEEALYLEAILNSDALTQRIRPLQACGEHNPRHYDKYVWQVPIPLYDPAQVRHASLVKLAASAEQIAAQVELPVGRRFEALRRMIREAIGATNTGHEIEEVVAALLT
jgi:SAM-dependent methyltransferase